MRLDGTDFYGETAAAGIDLRQPARASSSSSAT
jgi:hypothetical protein